MQVIMNPFLDEKLDELIRKCGEGDRIALNEFFESFSNNIYLFPIRVFHLSEDDAGDFFIYAFERLKDGKKLKTFNKKSSFKTWFYTVLRNLLIDWQKTRHFIHTTSANRINKEGEEYYTIEMEPDPSSPEKKSEEKEIVQNFYRALSGLKIEQRVLFKLAYLYYLNFDSDEVKYLSISSGKDPLYLKNRIFEIREKLAEKNKEAIQDEDKLTYLHTQIRDIEFQLSTLNEGVETDKIEKMKDILSKKKQQRKNLLVKRTHTPLILRTSFRDLSEILEMKELTISVSLSRILEKIDILLKKNEK